MARARNKAGGMTTTRMIIERMLTVTDTYCNRHLLQQTLTVTDTYCNRHLL
jgi:hypothetical protein